MVRMLMVDDEELIVNSICSYIEQHFEVELYRAFSGFEAMGLLQKMRFDIVITDISMPLMDGLDLLKSIKRTWAQCHVIILTAYDSFDYAYQSMKYDNVDYILKLENYSVIHHTIQKALDRIESEQHQEQLFIRLGEHIEQMKPQLCNDIVLRLLRRREALPPVAELNVLDFGLSPDRRVLLVAGMLDSAHYDQLTQCAPQISQSVTSKLRERGVASRFYLVGHCILWLMQIEGVGEQAERNAFLHVKDVFERLPDNLESGSGLRIALAIHQSFSSWESLPDVFERAMDALDGMRNANGLLVFSDAQRTGPERVDCLSIDDVNLLWEYIKTDHRQLFSDLLSNRLQPLIRIADMTAALPLSAVSALSFLYAHAMDACGGAWDHGARKVLNCQDHVSGQGWVLDVLRIFDELFDHRAERSKTNLAGVVSRIDRYVQEHYKQDIHISGIADEFHYSPSYLSRMYKENTGSNLTARITQIRLAHAKRLLETTTLSVGDVARDSGFYSTKYFMQAFKKAIGLTPSQYRNDSSR